MLNRNEKSTFYRTFCLWGAIWKENLAIFYFLDKFGIMLKYFDYFQSFQTKLYQFTTLITYPCNIKLSGIIQSDQSILGNESGTKILPGMELGMRIQV